ncbi:MAG TPA: RbsD/FucU domain-containing protein [Candidatus Acidoferrum sp.]|nr:RbsD/FucU domain-containing protein [Candidatus Acidoferrum sp.]
MKTSKLQLFCATAALVLLAAALLRPASPSAPIADWQTTLHQRLLVYGHRNWIIVSDAAFPAYSQSSIETIAVNEDLPSVLRYVAKAISSSKHVQATPFVDQELQFVPEDVYPGVVELRQDIANTFGNNSSSSIPHAELISKIDEAAKTFRVLLIKTNTTIPYTSVFLRLDCGYLSDEVERKIRNSMPATTK